MFIFGIIMLVASYLLESLMSTKKKPKPASLQQFDFPQVDEGTPQAVVFGDVWTQDWVVLWYGNLRSDAIHAKQKKGSGK